jgi:hypothetical protein
MKWLISRRQVTQFPISSSTQIIPNADGKNGFQTYMGLSGQKSFGEQLNNFASSFKCRVLYFALEPGLSICPIKLAEVPR